jgi:hypothetical protein
MTTLTTTPKNQSLFQKSAFFIGRYPVQEPVSKQDNKSNSYSPASSTSINFMTFVHFRQVFIDCMRKKAAPVRAGAAFLPRYP